MSQSFKVSKEFGSVSAKSSGVQSLSGAGALGALSQTSEITIVKTTGASTATLGVGKIGTKKTIIQTADAGDFVLTSTFVGGLTTATFADVGDSLSLVYTPLGWAVVGNVGLVVIA